MTDWLTDQAVGMRQPCRGQHGHSPTHLLGGVWDLPKAFAPLDDRPFPAPPGNRAECSSVDLVLEEVIANPFDEQFVDDLALALVREVFSPPP